VNKLLLFILFFVFLKAGIINDFKKAEYDKICNFGNITKTSNEKLLSIIGISCVKTDNLYLLPLIVMKLKHTKIGRQNAIYLDTIYLQKRLLYSYFFDDFSLNGFNLPKTDYILSIVFNKIKKKEYKKIGNIMIINLKNENLKIYKVDDKLVIDEYNKKNFLIKRHWYK